MYECYEMHILQETEVMNLLEKCWIFSFQSILCCAAREGKPYSLYLVFYSLNYLHFMQLIFPSLPTLSQIASLTLMKDAERLDLLKEIGGTRVYEERRRESLKIMQETGKSLTYFSCIIVS